MAYEPPEGGALGFDLRGLGYTAPNGTELAFNFQNRPSYLPPIGNQVPIAFGPSYQPPQGSKVGLEFVQDGDQQGGDAQYLFPVTFETDGYGSPVAWNYDTRVAPASIDSTLAFGSQAARNYLAYVAPIGIGSAGYGRPAIKNRNVYLETGGIYATGFGWPSLINWSKDVFPRGFLAQEFSRHPAKVWNLLQIRSIRGFSASFYGRPFVAGGVKYLYLKGIGQSGYGRPVVINTTADQYANPKGIAPPLIGYASVSPRMVYPRGLLSGSYGNTLVQFPPYPAGWESSRTGTPEIDYWTKTLLPAGIGVGEPFGYPVVRDRAKNILVPSLLGTGIFGDTRLHSTASFIYVAGSDFFEPSSYTELRSNKRDIRFPGFNAELFGEGSVWNKTPSLSPVGIAPILISPASVGYWQRRILASGYQSNWYGKPTLTQTPSIAPKGFAGEAGTPTVWPAVRGYDFKGFDSQKIGDLTVWFAERHIPMESGFRSSRHGTPVVEHYRRWLLAKGALRDSYGNARISNLDRTVAPKSIFEEFATGHMVGGLRFLKTYGFVATKFGERIIPPIQSVYPLGFTNAFGLAELYNQTTVVPLEGITTTPDPVDSWGTARVYSSRQYIEMFYDVDSDLNPPQWPRWTLIENRNKIIGAIGTRLDLFGDATAYLNARLLTPAGIVAPRSPEHYKSGMVSYRIRKLPIEGLEAPYLLSWSRVYNDAFIIKPRSFKADVYGDAELKNTRRYFPWIGGLFSEKQGIPMIAYRVRSIEFEPRYSIAPPRIQLHVVDLYTRYIDKVGDDMAAVPMPSLSIHFKKIHTRWTHRELFGWADLRNLTPEVITRGRASDEYGDSLVRLEWRPVKPDGSGMELFGRTVIADRDRSVSVRGLNAGMVSDKLIVIKTGQPPYTEQWISLQDHGISFPGAPDNQLPSPVLNQSVLYARGHRSDKFGDAHLQSNAIIVDHGIRQSDHERIGRHFVGLLKRFIDVPEGTDFMALGKPRLSPHTIWARPAPSQANQNHLGQSFYPVGQTVNYPPGERFGWQRISTYRGDVYARTAGNQSSYGRPRLYLKTNYVSVIGIRSYRMGWHKLGDGTEYIEQFASSNFMVFGKPSISRPPYTGPQTIRLKGDLFTDIGNSRVEHLHRELIARGHDSYASGRRAPNNPYMWQGMRIGPLMPTIPEGFNTCGIGEAWISYRVRDVSTQGFYSFISEYDLENFNARMRVRNSYQHVKPEQHLQPVGMDLLVIVPPNVALRTHYILPDGNAEQYRKGAPN